MRADTWKRSAEALGRVCIAFQDVEDAITSAISYLLQSKEPTIGRIVSSELSFRVKVNVLYALFDHSNDDKASLDNLTDILKLCFDAESLRNALIHSSWSYTQDEPEMVLRQKRSARFRKGYKIASEEMSPEDIDDIEERLSTCAISVTDFMANHFDDFDASHFALHLENSPV